MCYNLIGVLNYTKKSIGLYVNFQKYNVVFQNPSKRRTSEFFWKEILLMKICLRILAIECGKLHIIINSGQLLNRLEKYVFQAKKCRPGQKWFFFPFCLYIFIEVIYIYILRYCSNTITIQDKTSKIIISSISGVPFSNVSNLSHSLSSFF